MPPIEESAPENQDTPDQSVDSGTPQETPADAPEIPEGYIPEDRYKEAQAWGTRAAQEAAEWRNIVTLAQQGDREALDFLGYAPADEDEDTDDEDYETEQDRLDRIEQQLAEQQEQAQQAEQGARLEEAANRFYEVEFNRLDPDNEWTQEYRQLVAAVGDEYLDDDGLPRLDEAHKVLQAHTESEFKKRVASKRGPQAPSGASPTHTPDLDDPEQRREYLARRAAEVEQDF